LNIIKKETFDKNYLCKKEKSPKIKRLKLKEIQRSKDILNKFPWYPTKKHDDKE